MADPKKFPKKFHAPEIQVNNMKPDFNSFNALEQVTKSTATEVFNKIINGEEYLSPRKEQEYLRFISAAAKFARNCRTMKTIVEDPNFGVRMPAPRVKDGYEESRTIPPAKAY